MKSQFVGVTVPLRCLLNPLTCLVLAWRIGCDLDGAFDCSVRMNGTPPRSHTVGGPARGRYSVRHSRHLRLPMEVSVETSAFSSSLLELWSLFQEAEVLDSVMDSADLKYLTLLLDIRLFTPHRIR